MATARARIAYFNGRFVPEPEVRVPFRDRGFKYGDAVFDTTRTFGHRIFKMREHIERLYRSLRYLRIDPVLAPAAMAEVTEEVLRQNLPLLEPDDDYWSRSASPAVSIRPIRRSSATRVRPSSWNASRSRSASGRRSIAMESVC